MYTVVIIRIIVLVVVRYVCIFYTLYLNYMLLISSASLPEVTVEAMVNIDINLKEVSQYRVEMLSAALKRKAYTSSEAVINVKQDYYLQTQYKRLFIVDSMSSKMYERLSFLNTFNSRVENYTKGEANEDLRKRIIPLTDELIHNEYHPNKIIAETNSKSSWLARLLAGQSTAAYTPMEVPINGVQVTITHLRNCKYLPQSSCPMYIPTY